MELRGNTGNTNTRFFIIPVDVGVCTCCGGIVSEGLALYMLLRHNQTIIDYRLVRICDNLLITHNWEVAQGAGL